LAGRIAGTAKRDAAPRIVARRVNASVIDSLPLFVVEPVASTVALAEFCSIAKMMIVGGKRNHRNQ
jgi:hypothetical protein